MTDRFLALARYAERDGAAAILFTCSAFGPCIDAVKQALPNIPVLKPNEAMIEEAVEAGGTVGLLATFAPTLRRCRRNSLQRTASGRSSRKERWRRWTAVTSQNMTGWPRSQGTTLRIAQSSPLLNSASRAPLLRSPRRLAGGS